MAKSGRRRPKTMATKKRTPAGPQKKASSTANLTKHNRTSSALKSMPKCVILLRRVGVTSLRKCVVKLQKLTHIPSAAQPQLQNGDFDAEAETTPPVPEQAAAAAGSSGTAVRKSANKKRK